MFDFKVHMEAVRNEIYKVCKNCCNWKDNFMQHTSWWNFISQDISTHDMNSYLKSHFKLLLHELEYIFVAITINLIRVLRKDLESSTQLGIVNVCYFGPIAVNKIRSKNFIVTQM